MMSKPAVLLRPDNGNPGAHGFRASITVLRSSANNRRSEDIRRVVDGYRRLRDTVCRFLSMLADSLGDAQPLEALSSRSFDELIASVIEHARAADFRRIDELLIVAEEARLAKHRRNIVFMHDAARDGTAMRDAALVFEYLDARFAGLCVDHLMDVRSRLAHANAYLD
ncbi:hypothetical protein [Caballeronia sp. ATUFL_M2_KS44]|uniref:hypothetical protein n=1 Tax=Caballeronia sp. ATUFL_M2_KS44 TaxID=2921767 RepID=UPI002027F19F|nr:hypothetical protein [Caballeronia sp. ATUFL_M2_KS44]